MRIRMPGGVAVGAAKMAAPYADRVFSSRSTVFPSENNTIVLFYGIVRCFHAVFLVSAIPFTGQRSH
jgi:hypothetical protein